MVPALGSLSAKQRAFRASCEAKKVSTSFNVACSASQWHRWRRHTAAAGAGPEQQLSAARDGNEGAHWLQNPAQHAAAAALTASGLAAIMLMSPGSVWAEDLPPAAAPEQALSILLPARLSAPEAPGLVADSGNAVLEGVKGIVESGLQDLAANSMTAVGGPVTGDVLTASANQAAADTSGAQGEQPAAAAAQHQPDPQQQQQQQQQQTRRRLPAVWCNAWQAYCDALERSPLPTKVYTGVVGTLIGDLTAQVLSHTSKQQQQQGKQTGASSASSQQGFQFDALRAGRLCLYSAVIGTPMGHYWYGLLESAVMPATPLAPAAVAAKVVLDQFVQTPFGMALFFAVMKALEGQPRQVQQELQSKMVPALLANWKLWPAAQLINFTLIPEEQRILYGNIVGICWTCVISNMQQAAAPTAAAAGGHAAASSNTSGSGAGVTAAARKVQPAAATTRSRDQVPARGHKARSKEPRLPVGVSFTLRRRSSSVAA